MHGAHGGDGSAHGDAGLDAVVDQNHRLSAQVREGAVAAVEELAARQFVARGDDGFFELLGGKMQIREMTGVDDAGSFTGDGAGQGRFLPGGIPNTKTS
jgi:hypothetical protein